MSLYLLNKSLTEHLGILDELIAYVGRTSSEYQSVLMFTHLRLKGAYLEVHFALVA